MVKNITYDEIRTLWEINQSETEEGLRVTQSSYRGENSYGKSGDFIPDFFNQKLYREPLTAGEKVYYPHGIVIEQPHRRNFYRGEKALYRHSIPTLLRKLDRYSSRQERELLRMVADMRIAEFGHLIYQFEHVRNWKDGDVLVEPLAQHYGLDTGWLDVTNDFRVALFFATCYYDWETDEWKPITQDYIKDSIDREDAVQYDPMHDLGYDIKHGVIFSMQSNSSTLRWALESKYFIPGGDDKVPVIGNVYGVKGCLPRDRVQLENLIYPIGFQPFMRCHMQNAYGIYMREPHPLQSDNGFTQLTFEHDDRLSLAVWEEMRQGSSIYPQEGLKQAMPVINIIKRLTRFSEDAFHEALYRNQYYRQDDEQQCRADLSTYKVDGQKIEIVPGFPWKLDSSICEAIEDSYRDFSIKDRYGINIMDGKRYPSPSPLYEPWMLSEDSVNPGKVDFKLRDTVDCGSTICDIVTLTLLQTLMTKQMTDF